MNIFQGTTSSDEKEEKYLLLSLNSNLFLTRLQIGELRSKVYKSFCGQFCSRVKVKDKHERAFYLGKISTKIALKCLKMTMTTKISSAVTFMQFVLDQDIEQLAFCVS